jgi:hypothetical protein
MKKNQRALPGLDDLKWEILRRNREYPEDYQKLEESPEWTNETFVEPNGHIWGSLQAFLESKWKVREMTNPSVSWRETRIYFPSGKAFQKSPCDLEPDEYALALVSGPNASQKQHTGRQFIWFSVDPQANIKTVKREIEWLIKLYR